MLMIRLMTESTAPRKNPATSPTVTPTTSTMNAVPRPTISDTCVPTISLLSESRPDSSQPNGCAPDGVAYVSHTPSLLGL